MYMCMYVYLHIYTYTINKLPCVSYYNMAQIKKRKKNKLSYLAIQKVRSYFWDLMIFKTWGKCLYLEAFILLKTKQHKTKTNHLV